MSVSRPGQPNFLVVVLDCMRASDFPGYSSEQADLPCLQGLLRESTIFRRTVSPAPWTLPSHASLFSGQYPWEHGTHARAGLSLQPSIRRISEVLANHGYRSFSLSANPLIEPEFNLTQGFDRAEWGLWWEAFLRVRRRSFEDRNNPRPSGSMRSRRLVRGGFVDRLLHRLMLGAFRYTAVMDRTNSVVEKLRPPEPGLEGAVSSWIEPTFAKWVSETPSDTPVFSFVNLVDTHEPYYSDGEVVSGLFQWLEYARCRQDYVPFLNGEWSPDPGQMRLLHRLYVARLKVIDRRLERLIGTLRQSGRWENTLLVVTSDHGQAFGEHGMMFHMVRPDETLLRIPLMVRFPGRQLRPVVENWASLTDVAPTMLEEAGISEERLGSGIPLQKLAEHERGCPVLATGDGLVWSHVRGRLSKSRLAKLDHTFGVAYEGNWKVVVDRTAGTTQAFDVEADPGEANNRWDPGDPQLTRLQSSARRVADRVEGAVREEISSNVQDRLESWGYM
ncbi:MAG: sulfatase [Thermoplasmata archaeon]